MEYRVFDSRRSKLAAAVMKGVSFLPFRKNQNILYLGASHGFTSSFISDIIEGGVIFCIDFAPRVVRDLVLLCEERENMIPLLENASKPDSYASRISRVDVIYQDVAQKNQVEILLKNIRFLKPRGYVLLAIKSRSINVIEEPSRIFSDVEKELKKRFKIVDRKRLEPLEKDHCFYVLQLK